MNKHLRGCVSNDAWGSDYGLAVAIIRGTSSGEYSNRFLVWTMLVNDGPSADERMEMIALFPEGQSLGLMTSVVTNDIRQVFV
jgi:hypothetical protein